MNFETKTKNWRDVAAQWRQGNTQPLEQSTDALTSAYNGFRLLLDWVSKVQAHTEPLRALPAELSHLNIDQTAMLSVSSNLSAAFQFGYPDDDSCIYLLVNFPEYEWLRQLPIHTVYVGEESLYICTLGFTPEDAPEASLPVVLIEIKLDFKNMRLVRAFDETAKKLGLAHIELSSDEMEVIEFDNVNTIPLVYTPSKEIVTEEISLFACDDFALIES